MQIRLFLLLCFLQNQVLASALVYIPKGPPPQNGYSVLVGLHGCKSDPKEFAEGARWREMSEKSNSILLLPQQDPKLNPDRCWNWFLPFNQTRGVGEPRSIVLDLTELKRSYPVDSSRVYVMGFSAGSAMANILVSCYPEVFRAAALHSGVQYKAAMDPWSAEAALKYGSLTTPDFSAFSAWQCSGGQTQKRPVIVIHGKEDKRVVFKNHILVVQQFLKLNGEKKSIKEIVVEDLAHNWSGGKPGFPYQDSKAPNASEMILEFFRGHGL